MFKVLILCLIAASATAQDILRFQSYSLGLKKDNRPWEYEDCSLLIVMDVQEEVVKVYSKYYQQYDVVASTDTYVDEDGDSVVDMDAVDQEGYRCSLRFLKRRNGVFQFQVFYENYKLDGVKYDVVTWVYDIKAKR